MWQKTSTPSGYDTLLYQGKSIHSRVDPIKEAERLINPLIQKSSYWNLMIGVGLGYHVISLYRALQKVRNYDFFILCIVFSEQEKNWLYQTCSELESSTHCLVLQSTDRSAIDNVLQEYSQDLMHFQSWNILKYYPLCRHFKQETFCFEQLWSQLLAYSIQNTYTQTHMNLLWIKNLIHNFKKNTQHVSVHIEGDVILVSAGSSVRDELLFIKEHQSTCPVVAVDTILPTLLEAQIIPDIVVSCDAQFHNYYDFLSFCQQSDPLSKIPILLADDTAYHKIFDHFSTVSMQHSDGMLPAWHTYLLGSDYKNRILSGGSVTSFALYNLFLMGAKRIVLIGQDLEYLPMDHAVSTHHYYEKLFNQSRFSTFFNHSRYWISRKNQEYYAQDTMLFNLTKWISSFFYYYPVIGIHKSPRVLIKHTQTYDHSLSLQGTMKYIKSHKKESIQVLLASLTSLFMQLQKVTTQKEWDAYCFGRPDLEQKIIHESCSQAYWSRYQNKTQTEEQFLVIAKNNLNRILRWMSQIL